MARLRSGSTSASNHGLRFNHAVFLQLGCGSVNMRISGKAWRFPSHFDSVDQVILHHRGAKTWTGRDGARLTCRPGDVLFIPAGVYHATTNHGPTMISNAAFASEDTAAVAKRFEQAYPLRVGRVDAGADELRLLG